MQRCQNVTDWSCWRTRGSNARLVFVNSGSVFDNMQTVNKDAAGGGIIKISLLFIAIVAESLFSDTDSKNGVFALHR